jgi:hypothetical protein
MANFRMQFHHSYTSFLFILTSNRNFNNVPNTITDGQHALLSKKDDCHFEPEKHTEVADIIHEELLRML